MNISTEVTNMHSSDVTMNSAVPTRSGVRRPHASLIGPTASCPRARPSMDEVKVNWTRASVVARSSAMAGNAGRYRSVASGPAETRTPSTTARKAVDRRLGTGALGSESLSGQGGGFSWEFRDGVTGGQASLRVTTLLQRATVPRQGTRRGTNRSQHSTGSKKSTPSHPMM